MGALGQVASLGSSLANKLGVIDEETASAISNTSNAVVASSDAISKAAEEITSEQSYYIGRAVAANLLATYPIYDDEALTYYLNQICAALTLNSAMPDIFNGYHVAILDTDEINAFATSGGHILLTRGLIACTDSEDSLAAVIAHEIAHIQAQHSIKAIKTSRLSNALVTTAVSTGAVLSNADVVKVTAAFNETVGDILNTLVNSGYSQTQEFEADALALGLMASAGYSPPAMLEMLHLLETNEAGKSGGFIKTHPSPASRIRNVSAELPKYNVEDTSDIRRLRYKGVK
jgi:predicted Zn-dependent protease